MSVSQPTESSSNRYERIDPDVRLMLLVKQGNAAAFEQLVEKHQSRLVMVLHHLVGDRARAEELAQDVFLRVYRAREKYVPTAKFSTWLYTITHNVASNAKRKLASRKEVHIAKTPSGSFPVQPLSVMAKDKSGLMPSRVADRQELAEILHRAIQSLSERQRMAMLLSRFEDMSYNEIAETMELTPQAVKSLLSRARGNLKDILKPYVDQGHLPISLQDNADHDPFSEE